MVEETPVPTLEELLAELEVESGIQCAVIDINKDTAATLLKLNTTNRPLSMAQVKLYASEMLRGKWKLNGEPLIFGVDDKGVTSIISGQHRLHAIVHASKVYESNPEEYEDAVLELHTVVISGVPLDAADSVDLGAARKHGHVLFRDEWVAKAIPKEWSNNNSRKAKWCNTLAGAARLVWLRSGGATVSSAPKFIVSEMLEFIKEQHPNLPYFISAVLTASEEEGAGLKISIPYVAGLCYVACLNEEGEVQKTTTETVLDAMLHIAQNDVKPGSAEHALVTYWNKMFSAPGSKDRDLDIVGPFVKALNAIIADEKVTAAKLSLTKKEAESYAIAPPLMPGWDESCFIYAAELRSEYAAKAETAKEEAVAARQKAREAKEVERAAKAAEKEAEKEAKEAEKAAAKAEAEAAKETVGVKVGIKDALAKAVKKPANPAPNAGIPTRPIKRKPTAAKA